MTTVNSYEQFVNEGTNKLMEILISSAADDDEKNAIVAGFSAELSRCIGDHEEMPDYDCMIHTISLQYVDKKLSDIAANPNASVRALDEAQMLCSRQKTLLRLFQEKAWPLPALRSKDPEVCEQYIRDRTETDQLCRSLAQLDQQIEAAVQKAETEISVDSCSEALVLLEKMDRILNTGRRKKDTLPAVKNSDIQKIGKKIAALKAVAAQRELLYHDIAVADEKLAEIASMPDTTLIQWQEAINLCRAIQAAMTTCRRERWGTPALRCGDPDRVLSKYLHYQSMTELDEKIHVALDDLASEERFRFFRGYCARQSNNIAACQKNHWPVPALCHADPEMLAQEAVRERAQRERAQKRQHCLLVIVVILLAVLFIGGYVLLNKDKENRGPFGLVAAVRAEEGGLQCPDRNREIWCHGDGKIEADPGSLEKRN